MLRRIVRAVGWTAAGLLGLCILLYLIALAINWRDREPSATAVHLTQLFRDRPAVADADNAFIYLQRWQLDPDRRKKLPARIQEFLETCRPGSAGCSAAFDSADGLFGEWTAADGELLDRYMAFIAHTGWREEGVFDAGQISPYNGAADGQKMLLLRARELAKQGDAVAVRELLERDLQFWRTVLQSSDILVSKVVATSALYRHFEWGNLILRKLPVASQAAAIPGGWSRGISDAERSMQRSIVGEWHFSSALLRQASADSFGVDEEVVSGRLATWLTKPMYQQQDTINRYAEHYWSVIRAFEAPLPGYPQVRTDIQLRADRIVDESFPFGGIYNLPGAWIVAITLSSTDLAPYAIRVGDIEGVRRAALAAATLRAERVDVKDVPAALNSAVHHDPYTDRPFEWDEDDRAIVFRGLQPGDRGEHRIAF